VDNATSHEEQMAPFVALVTADPEFADLPHSSGQRRVSCREDVVVNLLPNQNCYAS